MELAVTRTTMSNEALPQHSSSLFAGIGTALAAFCVWLLQHLRKSKPKAQEGEEIEDYATVREWRQSPAQELRHAISALREATEGMDRAIGNMSVDIESMRRVCRRLENTITEMNRENELRDERLGRLEKRSETQ